MSVERSLENNRLSLIFACSTDTNPGSQKIVSGHGIGNSSVTFHREMEQPFALHRLHGFFDRGLGCDGDSIVDHDIFRRQMSKIFAGFQCTENITLADRSDTLVAIIRLFFLFHHSS